MIRASIVRLLTSFTRRDDGTSAIEFAIVLPMFLLPVWFGFAEVGSLQERTTTLNTTTAMVSDMISRWPSVTQDNLDRVMTTAAYVLGAETAASADFTITVMGVVIPKEKAAGSAAPQKRPYAGWAMNNRRQTACPGFIDLPANVARPTSDDRTVIVADGELMYTSPLGLASAGTSELKHRSIYAPRETANPVGPNSCPDPN